MPLHLVLMPLHWRFLQMGWNGTRRATLLCRFCMIAHGAILLVQLLACAAAEGPLLWQVVNISRPLASVIAMGDIFGRTLLGAIYFLGVPILIAVVANSVGR